MNSDYINLGEASEMWGWDFLGSEKAHVNIMAYNDYDACDMILVS